MLAHYIKYAIRYLWKNKLFSFINIGGLTIGLGSCLLIINYIQQELSYDTFHENVKTIYRVNIIGKTSGRKAAAIAPPMGPTMLAEFPEVKNFVRLRHADNVLVKIDEEEFYENQAFYVDSSFFSIFNFSLLKGDDQTALLEKNTAVISEDLAIKYFRNEDPIGKTITVANELVLTITGVTEKNRTPSHLKFQLLISFSSFEVPMGYPVTLNTWGWTSFPTYVRLHKNANSGVVNSKFESFITKNMGEASAEQFTLELQPLKDIYLHSADIIERDGIPTKGDINYVIVLIAIAVLILLIATFNFTNLATALSLKRVKEIGVRKTLGAQRQVVFLQYCTESVVIVLISLVIAAAFLEVFNGPLSNLFNAPFDISENFQSNWMYYLSIVLVIGLSGGLYPAIYLSKFAPVKALKSKGITNNKSFSMKTVLLGLQFFITILLIAASVVINNQMNFMRERDLGYNKDKVIALQMQGEALTEKYMLTRQQLLQNPYVQSVTASGDLFDGLNGSVPIQERGNDESRERISLFSGHYDFAKTLGIEIIQGRDFSEEFANDSSSFILNEAAVRMFGWNENTIGKQLTLNNVWDGEVIGVVKDFNFASLHQEISPLVILIPHTYIDYIYVKTTESNLENILASLKMDWEKLHPEFPFDYTFLDSHIQNLYEADQKFSKLVYAFSGLAIFLACIGLYGIVAYSIDSRQKEIGIRKVFGASVSHVVFLLSKQFIVLIVVAALIALPVAWVFLKEWLTEFAYRIELSPLHLITAFVATLCIVGFTLSTRTIKAAQTNPVHTLKED